MTTDRIDAAIEKQIIKMLDRMNSMFTSEEEKDQIVERVAKLRMSMNKNVIE